MSVCFCAIWGSLTKQNTCWNEWKTLINSIYLHLWPLTTSWLQGLTVMQQCVYEFKKQLSKAGLVWSRTLLTLLNRLHALHNILTFLSIYCRQLKKETVRWSVSQCVKNVNKMCFCALFRLSNHTTLGKIVMFRWFCLPPVLQ